MLFKYHINPRARGYVDLMLTHSFTNKMFVIPYGDGYLFDSNDSKTGSLVGKYGGDIMGINQDWFDIRQRDVYRLTYVFNIKRICNIA